MTKAALLRELLSRCGPAEAKLLAKNISLKPLRPIGRFSIASHTQREMVDVLQR